MKKKKLVDRRCKRQRLNHYHPNTSSASSSSSSTTSSSSSSSHHLNNNHLNKQHQNLTHLILNSPRLLAPIPNSLRLSRTILGVTDHLNALSQHHMVPCDSSLILQQPLSSLSNIQPSNRKRKRNPPHHAHSFHPTHPSNENSRQVMVLINPSHPPKLIRTRSTTWSQKSDDPLASPSSHELANQRETDYYLRQASKPQLLRLKRDQLVQIIKASWERFHHRTAQDREEIENKNKDSLAAFIIDSRTTRHNSALFPSQSKPNQTLCFQTGRAENDPSTSQSSFSQPHNFARTLSRVKSLPDQRMSVDFAQSSRQIRNRTRSRIKESNILNLNHQPDSPPMATRKTRRATQAEELAEKAQLLIQSCSSNSRSSWKSIPSLQQDEPVHDHSTTRAPNPLPHRRKAVKFLRQRSCGQTPIAYRTRRSSNHRTPPIARISGRSSSRGVGRKRRNTTSTTTMDTSSLSVKQIVTTPTITTTRQLRNGKVIRMRRQTSLGQTNSFFPGQRESHSTEQETAESSDQDSIDDGKSSEIEEDESAHCMQQSDTSIHDAAQADTSEASDADAHSVGIDNADDQAVSDSTGSTGYDSEQDEGAADDELIDLSHATSKRLLRLKRDNLVKLCTERDLEAEGTKKDLVQNLLVWRDSNDMISPSSDPCERSSGPSDHSEEEEEEEDQKSTSSVFSLVAHSVPETTDGTHSRPILLDSDNCKPKANLKKVIKTANGSTKGVAAAGAHKKDDVGELLDLERLNLQDKEIHYDQLKKMEKIGSGGFKDVYKGMYKKVTVAIAEIRGHLTEMDLKELRILRDLRHENIVRFIGVSVPGDSHSTNANNNSSTTGSTKEPIAHPTNQIPIMIITELCTNGDLYDYIRNTKTPSFNKIIQIFKDICKGLNYLHNHQPKIIHRDLKSSNVLITSKGVAKLNDFGLARIKNSTRSLVKSLVGTVNWQAPELWVAHPRYNEKVDVYSAGLVLWEMLQWHQPVKRYPFEGQNEHAIYQDVGQRQLRPSTAGMRRHWGDEIINLVEKLWAQNPFDRPDMTSVLVELDLIVKSI